MTGQPRDRGKLDVRAGRLTVLYIAALSAVAILSLAGQMLVQFSLQRQLSDSTVVNIAGRQRMLSQRLSKASLALVHASGEPERARRSDEIETVLQLWRQSHRGLQQGDPALGLPGNNSPAVAKMFADLQPPFEAMGSAVDELRAGGDETAQASPLVHVARVNRLLALEPQFLSGMDAIVYQYDREAHERVARLRRIEWAFLAVTLAVLLCEGLLVFRPAVRHIKSAAAELIASRRDLQRAKEAAEAANEAKTRFLANISHELRNPLHAVLGNTELALQGELSSRQRRYLTTVDDSARSLLQLLNDLLDMSRIDAGALSIVSQPFDVVALTQRCVAMFETQAEAKGLELHVSYSATDKVLMGDAARIRQVLVNLLANAIKFTDRGSVRLQAQVTAKSDSAAADELLGVRFEVEDTGIGIAAEQQRHVFESFAQVDASSRREYGGAGLGLAISAKLVELMGGQCGVRSELGQGSLFWVELPLQPAFELPTDGGGNTLREPAVEAGSRAAAQVLVVEDDPINRQLVGELLKVLGHHVVLTEDGDAALLAFRENIFEVVLLDLQMPRRDGYEVARLLRQYEAEMGLRPAAIIALSAAMPGAGSNHSDRAHVDWQLSKPAGVNELRTALEQALSRRPRDSSSLSESADYSGRGRWRKALERLQGREALFRELATLFVRQLPDDLCELQAAVKEQNWDRIHRVAHLLHGQAAAFEGKRVVEFAQQVEGSARDNDLTAVQSAAQHLTLAAEQLAQQLSDDWLPELQPTADLR